ncbi:MULTISPECIES: molybdenum cofactor guanylyltransferase MobA [unclassified Beijerinckia]|uniref:molybdenum cofactor guanylyltransferase MobA n=1 Tax=unclassified Beijerinckia TaxID=2638183 RepID=UPI00089CA95F|nr:MULTISPECIES: molybdenum cofactor guanylyltransferase MobA [unclassified Beijerinckia]MDH7795249.1 molybdopterin-guanine dinucleotide biosynthesis protein A [Beijerinckia sp. GAS462]SEB93638.1 molybdenum cofactor guanylyltransferase [Beijerinckia sp. 28-YEA-48]
MNTSAVCAVVLAGGQARRMGGEKAFATLAGKPLIAHVIARLAPQCHAVAINSNDDPAGFQAFALPVLADTVPDFPGPLAGILAAMDWCATTYPDDTYVLTAPVDCPFLPDDLAKRLWNARDDMDIVVAGSGEHLHPTVALWRVALREDLRAHLISGGTRRLVTWIERYRHKQLDWPTEPFDPFFNANTPDDLNDAILRLR